MTNKNPFSNNRAEYMEDIWKFYVPFNDLNMDNAKPLVIEGGRGTGKTMFFLCNSWRAMLSKYSDTETSPVRRIVEKNNIGLYYKVDPSFVASMNENGREIAEWKTVFSTYLSVVLVKELVEFLIQARDEQVISRAIELKLSMKYASIFRGNSRTFVSFEDVVSDVEMLLNDIEDVINNPDFSDFKFRKTNIGNGLSGFFSEVCKYEPFTRVALRIYIDEYESLIEWQQRMINSLIKKSDNRIIYNIGMKPMGMKTYATLAAEEQLQETHDYKRIKLDDLVLADEYKQMVLRICQKRLEIFRDEEGVNVQSVDIRTYLGDSDISKELELLEKKEKPRFYLQLRDVITKRGATDVQLAQSVLCDSAPLLNARLHLALLMRNTKYAPSVDYLLECYQAWVKQEKNANYDKYKEWLHTTQNGLVFLLAKECHSKKQYYGFDTFISLSSGTIRYFLELCEQTINIAFRGGFSWENESTINIETQTRAAYLVSTKKVMEIESYAEDGRRLRIFTQCLGELFQDLHKNEKNTLSEPEPNHFSTDSLTHSSVVNKSISDAIQWSVLLTSPSTKDKANIKTNITDYHLNKIYAPYFGISCLKKRKIELNAGELEELFSGDMIKAQGVVKKFLKKYWDKNEKSKSEYEQFSWLEGCVIDES
ncbi:hypothetical protein SAMN02910301_0410 [Lachnospiraceae bacterium XBD2001]|nr:hypothetical protein SAMN02910301_0410 [Lachnospiraceae bacterium XBD2001]